MKETAITFLTMAAAGNVREAFGRCVAGNFRHHNPFFRGDAASLMTAMEANAKQNPEKVFEVRTAIEEGDRVAVHSHVRQRPEERGVAVVHLFRFEGGRIAELWDVGQPVPEEAVNENGMF